MTPVDPGVRPRSAVLPAVWLVGSAIWAAVVIITDLLAWPLALWIATTIGPVTALGRPASSSSLRPASLRRTDV